MLGNIITERKVPAGLVKVGKGSGGANAAEYAEFIRRMAELKVNTGLDITQDEIEYSLGVKASYTKDGGKTIVIAPCLAASLELAKTAGFTVVHAAKPLAMPKCFLNNMRKRIAEKFGDDENGKSRVTITPYNSGKGTKFYFQVWKESEAPAAAPAAK